MTRSILTTYFFVPLLAVTFVTAWIGFSSSNPSSQSVRSTEPAQHMQSAPAIYNSESAVRFVHHGPNHPPVLNSPREDHSRVVLFPRGPGATLVFEGEPATDHEGDILTYRFGFSIPGMLGLQPTEKALLKVTRLGNRFFIRPDRNISPVEFSSVYGNIAAVPNLSAAIYASDGKSVSEPMFFDLTLAYDGSSPSTSPEEYMGEQHWEFRDRTDRLEATWDPGDGAFRNWKAVTTEARSWRLDPSPVLLGTIRTVQTAR